MKSPGTKYFRIILVRVKPVLPNTNLIVPKPKTLFETQIRPEN